VLSIAALCFLTFWCGPAVAISVYFGNAGPL
jgi:hypothetical protein